MRIAFSLMATVAGAGLAVISVIAAQDEKIVPVHQEPRHHLVFDSPLTKILNVQIPPGDMTLFHTHSDPILYVNMSSSQTRSQSLGGSWSGGEAPVLATNVMKAADAAVAYPTPRGRMMSVTSYAKQSLTHRVFNGGKTVYWLIGTTNATAGDESTAPSADFDAKPEIDNRWFRGYRWTIGERMVEHRHANPVTIVLVAGRAHVDGAAKTALDRYGAFAFVDASVAHTLQGLSADAEIIEVEIRRPR